MKLSISADAQASDVSANGLEPDVGLRELSLCELSSVAGGGWIQNDSVVPPPSAQPSVFISID
jgi:hypothetical protein